MRFLVIGQVLACRGFLYATINETHHAVKGLVHLVILVSRTEVVLQVGFLRLVTAAIRPEGVFRVVELETAIKVGVHKVRMARIRGRKPVEQA